ARKLTAEKTQDELWLADFLLAQGRGVVSVAEFLEFVELLKPVYERQPAELAALLRWQAQLRGTYEGINRHEEALALSKSLADAMPWNEYEQTEHARRLVRFGQPQAAYAHLQQAIARAVERDPSQEETLRSALVDLYRQDARWADLLAQTTAWVAREPHS